MVNNQCYTIFKLEDADCCKTCKYSRQDKYVLYCEKNNMVVKDYRICKYFEMKIEDEE